MQDNYAYLYRIAKLYYEGGLSQNEIADREFISRPQVSRFLDRAKRLGIVRIIVEMPDSLQYADLKTTIKSSLKMQDVLVVPVTAKSEENEGLFIQEFAFGSMDYITALLDNKKVVGLGWGRTLYNIALQLPNLQHSERIFVPLMGNSGVHNRYLQVTTIVNRFGERYGAECFYLNMPIARDTNFELTPFEKSTLNELKGYWNRMDAALVGLGPALRKSNFYYDEITPAVLERYNYDFRAMGEMISQAFYEDGSSSWFGPGYNWAAIDLQHFKSISNTILVAGGYNKHEAIYWACKLGFCKILITDNETALAMVRLIEQGI
ncbi:winged helix-turn-helix transcriptional regulator [Eubacteriales bacterium OttesenSCG-928-N14]|nr:winged helix-turn-helix transcriptional regulator [Eubacteriales bacterium OttesenSCG-928-N14]